MYGTKSQRGSALLTALFICAVAAALSTVMMVHVSQLLSQAQSVKSIDRANVILSGTAFWARAKLTDYAKLPADTPFPRHTKMQVTYQGIHISATLTPLQGRFNLNDLTQPSGQQRFAILLTAVVKDMTPRKAQTLVRTLTSTFKNDSSETPFFDKTELRTLPGMTATLYRQLSPYLTALPTERGTGTAVDINDTSWPVLMTLADKTPLSAVTAKTLQACIQSHPPFTSTKDFSKQCGLSQSLNPITTRSQYFLLRAQAKSGTETVVQTRVFQLSSKQVVEQRWQRST